VQSLDSTLLHHLNSQKRLTAISLFIGTIKPPDCLGVILKL